MGACRQRVPSRAKITAPIDLVRDLEAALDGQLDLVTTLGSALEPDAVNNCDVRSHGLFCRERCARLGDEATRSGHAGAPSRRLAGYAGGRATVAA
jgi:hypothetical protein